MPAPGAARAPVVADLLTAQGRAARACALPCGLSRDGAALIPRASGLIPRASGATLADLVAQEWPGSPAGLAASIDGRPVPREAWARTPLRGGEIVTLRAVLAGGGDDKNPLAAILQIGLLVAAIVVPPLLFASTWAQTLTGAAITIAGGLIVNALAAPPAAPALPPPERAQAEPVFSLTGGANRARTYAPLLLVLGAHRVFPDLGAAEYTEIVDGEQYLHQIFNFGLGDLAIDELRIGETALASYDEVETEFADALGEIELVAGNVDSAAGGALEDTAFVERMTGQGTRRIGIDLAGRIFRIDDQGDIQANSIDVEIEWEPADGSGPLTRRTVTLTNDDQAPYRRTLAYGLGSAGAWTVRVRRTADPDASDRVYDASLPPVRARIVAVEPATDRRVRFTAIDEVQLYYDAALADLSAPLPVLRGRAPRVLDITIAESLVRVGAGFAVEIEAALAAAAWAPYPAGATVRGRWVQLRWRITGDGSLALALDHLCWSAHAPGAIRKLLDRNTADWQGTAAAGRIVPHDLGLVTDLDVTLQSVGAGWSWTLLNKNAPTRIRIYDGAGDAADASVDVIVRGVAA